jgi:hypothetical protein
MLKGISQGVINLASLMACKSIVAFRAGRAGGDQTAPQSGQKDVFIATRVQVDIAE